jgi:hypothetical protein
MGPVSRVSDSIGLEEGCRIYLTRSLVMLVMLVGEHTLRTNVLDNSKIIVLGSHLETVWLTKT